MSKLTLVSSAFTEPKGANQ